MIIGIVVLHLIFLHQTGSNNPLGYNSDSDRISFHLYYSSKDFVGFTIAFTILIIIIAFIPNYFRDPENYLIANSSVTPAHIKPE